MAEWMEQRGAGDQGRRNAKDSVNFNSRGNLYHDDSASEERTFSTSITSTTKIPPTAEEIDRWHQHTTLEKFGKTVNKNAKLVFSSETRSRYTNVYVLILKWEREDPNLPVSYEIEDLRKVLEGRYHFQIEVFEIPAKKSHARVSEKINAFVDINGDIKDDLKIVYYAGHSRLSKTKDLVWSSIRDKGRQVCSTVTWTGIQKCLEQAESDVLILLDCCSAGIGNSGEGNGVTQLISACAFDVEANGVGHYSFTKALTIELGLLSSKTFFSVDELYQNVYCRAQHHLAQGLENERYPAPIHLHLTRERGLERTIQLSVHQSARVMIHGDAVPLFHGTASAESSDDSSETRCSDYSQSSAPSMSSSTAGIMDGSFSASTLNDEVSSEYSASESSDTNFPWPENTPRIHLGIRLDDKIRAEDLSSDYFTDWLRALPAAVREVRVDAGLTSDSSLLLLSLPSSLRPYLPQRLIRDLDTQELSEDGSAVTTPVAVSDPATPLTSLQFPESFQASYVDYLSYPMNLVLNESYAASLKSYKNRLDQFAIKVLSIGPSYVLFHDFKTGSNDGLEKGIILNDSTLKEWLGGTLASSIERTIVRKTDPRSRFIFINGIHACDRLPITRPMLVRILTYHQVMPAYLDFLSGFDPGAAVSDFKFSGFREQTSLIRSYNTLEIQDLGRSGYNFQLCYSLIAVAYDSLPGKNTSGQQWAITQAAFHHQFDVREGTALWIVTHTNGSVKEKLTAISHINASSGFDPPNSTSAEQSLASSLSTHLLLCQWSMEGWRGYIKWLEETFQRQSSVATYTKYHLEDARYRRDKIQEAIMEMEANINVLCSLRNFYRRLVKNRHVDFIQKCEDDITTFASQIEDVMHDFKSQIACSKLLLRIASDRESLLHQHLHNQSTSKIEEMTRQIMELARDTRKETVSMRTITVVTLIYLPATFVSTFFSTDIVQYREPSDLKTDEHLASISSFALQRWLQFTLPLTGVTLLVWWVFLVRSRKAAARKYKTTLLPVHGEPGMSWHEKKRL